MRFIPLMFVFILLSPTALPAQQALVDPGIPDGETAVYAVKAGKDAAVLTQRVSRITNNGRMVYEVVTESALDDMKVRINAATMAVEYSWVRRKRPELVLETETKTVKNTLKTKPDEISVADYSGLQHILRGFPFGRLKTVKMRMAQGSDFVMNIINTKETDIKTPAGTIRCYEIELGLDGFLGAFMPKTQFWFSREAPHYLVRYRGQMAGPGSPELVMELTSYGVK
jgi:hypothetical protein